MDKREWLMIDRILSCTTNTYQASETLLYSALMFITLFGLSECVEPQVRRTSDRPLSAEKNWAANPGFEPGRAKH